MCLAATPQSMTKPAERGHAAQASTAAAAATWPMLHAYNRVIATHPHAHPPVVVLATAAAVCALFCASRAASTTLSTTSLACVHQAVKRTAVAGILRLRIKAAVGCPVTNILMPSHRAALPSRQTRWAGRQQHPAQWRAFSLTRRTVSRRLICRGSNQAMEGEGRRLFQTQAHLWAHRSLRHLIQATQVPGPKGLWAAHPAFQAAPNTLNAQQLPPRPSAAVRRVS